MKRTTIGRVALTGAFFFATFAHADVMIARAAGTASGTVISNQATATYTDANNVSYTTKSNVVTTTVQDAASLTVTAPSAQTISPLQTTSDVYTLTNTGNGPGTFALQTGTTTTLGTATNVTYTISGVSGLSAGCSAALASIAQVNNCFLHNDPTTTTGAAVTVAAGATAQIAIGFTVNAGTAPGTQTTTLVANVTQGSTASANATGTVTDTIAADAAMSLTKAATVGGTAAAPTVAYVVAARNTGARPAAYLTPTTTLTSLGLPATPALLVSDKLPTTVNGTALTFSTTPAATCVAADAANFGAAVAYTTVAGGATGWTVGQPTAAATYVGCVVTSTGTTTGNAGLPGGAGAAQITLSFTLVGSKTAGDGNPAAVTNFANMFVGTQGGFIVGPTVPAGTKNNGTNPIAGYLGQTTVNDGGTGTGGAGTGEADIASAASPSALSVLTGPFEAAGTLNGADASGSYSGGAANQNDDFEAFTFSQTQAAVANATGPGVPFATAAAQSVIVKESLANTGNTNDTYTISGALNATPTAWPSGTTIGFTTNAAGTGATATLTTPTVNATTGSNTFTYYAVVTIPAGANVTPFTPYDATVTATSRTTGTVLNTTHDDGYAAGFMQVTKAAQATSDACATAAANIANPTPGGCLVYTLTYTNVAPNPGAAAVPSLSLTAQTGFTLSDDGTTPTGAGTAGSPVGWFSATSTAAINAATAIPTIGITTAVTMPVGATATYYPWSYGSQTFGAATTTFSPPTGTPLGSATSGPAKVTIALGAPVAPQATGSAVLKVQVRNF